MATARKLPSGAWRVRVYSHKDENGKKHYKSFNGRTKRDAESQAAMWQAERGTYADMTLSEAVNAYIESREAICSPSTIKAYRSIQNSRLGRLERVSIDDITREMVQREINNMIRSGTSPKTVRNVVGFLSAVLNAFRPDFNLRVELPKKQRPDLVIPSDEQVTLLLDAVKGTEMELPIMLAAFGPMRRGEICALRTDNIEGTLVHVCENMVMDTDNNWITKSPKTYAGDRYIDYPDFVAELWQDKTGRVTDLTPTAITHRFVRLRKRLGLDGMRFHDLRHYSASIQHALGIPDAYIMQRGGWSSDIVLKSIYRHAMSDTAKEMSKKANSHFGQIRP